MACRDDWEMILKGKYCSYKVEIDAYLESLEIATSTEISATKIYYAIHNDKDVNENLKKLYCEAVFGTNKDVKARIKSRIANFRRSLKEV